MKWDRKKILMKYLIFLAAGNLSGSGVACAASALVNGSFDAFNISSPGYNAPYDAATNPNGYSASFTGGSSRMYLPTVAGMGWRTSATGSNELIEIWNSGSGIPPAHGIQFAEINAVTSAALYQDVQITESGLVDYSFDHRGRSGTDTMRVVITYLGVNNVPGGGDDLEVVNRTFSSGQAWNHIAVDNAFLSVTNGFYRFSFGAVSTATGNNSVGNFIDNVRFGVNVVPEPSSLLLYGSAAGCALLIRRRSSIR